MEAKENYNFLLLGDSILKGITFDEERQKYITLDQCFANLLSQELKGVLYNAGKFGNTIVRGEKKLEYELNKSHPDIVLIEFGGNDCDYKWEEIRINPNGKHEPNTELGLFEARLMSIIDLFKNREIVPVLMTLPPLDPDRFFNWITLNNPVYSKAVMSFIGSINELYLWQEKYSMMINSVVEQTKAICIDVRGAFLKEENYREFICADGIHPNEKGHKLIANTFIEFINTNYNFLLA